MRRYVDISANYFTIRFNSRTREGCDFIYPLDAVRLFAFQFTHPGGVRLRDRDPRLEVDDVSIHAPGRGATRIRPHVRHTHDVSIHAPGRGATLYLCRDLEDKQSFNSRTREGCDPCRCVGDRGELYVSIHAPGRGATHLRHGASMGGQSFNSRTREGCDVGDGVRGHREPRFNSRTREGCDVLPLSLLPPPRVFQFTHPGGVRLSHTLSLFAFIVFQFTHPGGVRLRAPVASSEIWSFNSRTREGCDQGTLPDDRRG